MAKGEEFNHKNVIAELYHTGYCATEIIIATMSQTLFGNPKGPVELGNPNTCAETKLCLNFILFWLKK